MIAKAIQIMYSCDPCKVSNALLNVPARLAGQDVNTWMDDVATRIATDHRTRFPHCNQQTISAMKIPIGASDGTGPQAPWIGAVPTEQ